MDITEAKIREISKEVDEHQKAVFGRLLTDEEYRASEEDRRKENNERFSGLTVAEAAEIIQNEIKAFSEENAEMLNHWPTLADDGEPIDSNWN
ncbi:MAG: hypothetical protein LBQ58_03970 [Synergistaceae bacterium]|jgi:hypothetical protein|nr:hypothetical protein [Synergistaceae bacterium]